MAERDSWPSIKKHGLLSTTALLDLFQVEGEARHAIESCHRPHSVRIEHPRFGMAVIRDQIPMRESALEKCLTGMTPAQWYEMLNCRVFFWATAARVKTLLSARAYRKHPHCVIEVDTAALLAAYSDRIALSPINSGSTIYAPQPRGVGTFLPLERYPFEQRRRQRGIANAVAELAVERSVPDLADFAVRVQIRRDGRVIRNLHSR
jgi:hypothetical protein